MHTCQDTCYVSFFSCYLASPRLTLRNCWGTIASQPHSHSKTHTVNHYGSAIFDLKVPVSLYMNVRT